MLNYQRVIPSIIIETSGFFGVNLKKALYFHQPMGIWDIELEMSQKNQYFFNVQKLLLAAPKCPKDPMFLSLEHPLAKHFIIWGGPKKSDPKILQKCVLINGKM